ncbi:MAG: ATP-binding cassette domain-containing protein [Microcoleus sp.]
MTIFTLRSVKKDFGIKELLTDASFSLDEGDKVGLVGTNGSGNSTLQLRFQYLLSKLQNQQAPVIVPVIVAGVSP